MASRHTPFDLQSPRNGHEGFSTHLIIALIAVAAVFGAVFLFAVNGERARARDVERLADLRVAEAGFRRLYVQTGSYAAAAEGCGEQGAALAACEMRSVGLSFADLQDPKRGEYVIQTVPSDTGFAVAFSLERGAGVLAAGEHVLTEQGIQ